MKTMRVSKVGSVTSITCLKGKRKRCGNVVPTNKSSSSSSLFHIQCTFVKNPRTKKLADALDAPKKENKKPRIIGEFDGPSVSCSLNQLATHLDPVTNPSPVLASGQEQSPSKALRAAMLKTRFAHTIFKAQQHTLFGDQKRDSVEKESLEKKQQQYCEDKVAELKKMKRDRERQAARFALQKMEEEAIHIYSGIEIMEQLEKLCGSLHCNPLERLGLFLKKDDNMGEDEEEEQVEEIRWRSRGDIEEGEIV